MNNFGTEEGAICWRNGCQGIIEHREVRGCSCHINPPCSACTDPREYCASCDWQAEDDHDYSFSPVVPGLSIMERVKPRPLDPRKIDYRSYGHSSCSMRKEGVYPPEATQKDVENEVRGTFGGRFERFGYGRFKYIAYTD